LLLIPVFLISVPAEGCFCKTAGIVKLSKVYPFGADCDDMQEFALDDDQRDANCCSAFSAAPGDNDISQQFEWPDVKKSEERWPLAQDRELWLDFEEKNEKKFKELLQKYQNPNAFNPRLYRSLIFNSKGGCYQLPKYDAYHPSLTIMHEIVSCAKENGAEEIDHFFEVALNVLREAGANFNIPLKRYFPNLAVAHENEQTPLHQACEAGLVKIVISLLIGNADPAACDCQRVTPVHIAAKHDHEKILEIFFDSHENPAALLGLKSDISDAYRLPIHYAARAGSLKALKIILDQAKKCNIATLAQERDLLGHTPLHDAVRYCDNPQETVKMLLSHDVQVNAQDNLGQTALHVLMQQPWSQYRVDTVQILLQHGENRALSNNKNQTPEMFLRTKYMLFRKLLWKQFWKKIDAHKSIDFAGEA